MSPLLFLAIAIVVPLLGMIVLGVGARIKHQKVTDDETEPFRRRLESIAPPDRDDTPSGTPGLVQTMRRLRAGNATKQAPRKAQKRPAPTSIRLVERDYSVPLLPPLSADLEELPQPSGERRSRRAIPRPPDAAPRHDRVIPANQRRRPGP